MSLLATVELQLVLRCLDGHSRLAAARCNKKLFAAASHPFAWPQDPLFMLRVENDWVVMEELGVRVRGSLLRLASIHLLVQLRDHASAVLRSEIFALPNAHGITVHPPTRYASVPADFLLPLLRHPAAPQLRVLDVGCLYFYRCSSAELQQLQTLPRLHSLSFGDTACDNLATLESLSLLSSLTHLTLNMERHQARLLPSLPLCSRLVSLKLSSSVIRTELVNCLAQLPSLQRLHLHNGDVAQQTAGAWAALRSLHEIHLDRVWDAIRLLPVLSSTPALRMLRWHCKPPWYALRERHFPSLPQLGPLGQLLSATPLLQVELLMPRTFDEWLHERTADEVTNALTNYQRRVWDELHQLPVQLPRVRIVAVESDDDCRNT
jgi:hypothetical protein